MNWGNSPECRNKTKQNKRTLVASKPHRDLQYAQHTQSKKKKNLTCIFQFLAQATQAQLINVLTIGISVLCFKEITHNYWSRIVTSDRYLIKKWIKEKKNPQNYNCLPVLATTALKLIIECDRENTQEEASNGFQTTATKVE